MAETLISKEEIEKRKEAARQKMEVILHPELQVPEIPATPQFPKTMSFLKRAKASLPEALPVQETPKPRRFPWLGLK